MKKLIENKWYRINDRGDEYVAQYTGNDQDFGCCVCDKGCKAHTFNLWYADRHGCDYETWGFGPKHMPKIIEEVPAPAENNIYIRDGREMKAYD